MYSAILLASLSTLQILVHAAQNATQQAGNATAMANQTFDPTANLSSIPTSPNPPEVTPGS